MTTVGAACPIRCARRVRDTNDAERGLCGDAPLSESDCMLLSDTQIQTHLCRLEATDARAIGQLEALSVWMAALVQTHPEGERLRAVAHKLSLRSPFQAMAGYQEEAAAYDATFCQLMALSDGTRPAIPAGPPPRV